MDPVINSLVQSPLVRSMSTVPSKASSFVHGVRDNVPPFSFQKVVVQPWNNPSKTSQDQTHKFRIPQFGTLNRAYLRIKMKNKRGAGAIRAEVADYVSPNLTAVGNITTAVAESDYDKIRAHMRLPWIHKCQYGQSITRRNAFGQGGAMSVINTATMDPQDGTPSDTSTELHYSASNTILDPNAHAGKSSNAWNVVNILDEIRLTTNGKLVETVYGETIPAEVVKMPAGLRDYYTRGMVGWAAGNSSTGGFMVEGAMDYSCPWDPSTCQRDAYGRLTASEVQIDGGGNPGAQVAAARNHNAYFTVPVTLSSLKMLSKNYQTRFVEDLELEVKTKAIGRGFNDSLFVAGAGEVAYHDVELVLIYHNWHDNIENTIRNSNYKRGVPASVYSTNWVRAAPTTKVTAAGTGSISIPLTTRNLVTELLIVAKSKSAGNATFGLSPQRYNKSDYTCNLTGNFSYDLEFTGSGKTIWKGKNHELMGPDSADYDLTERRLEGGDCAYGGVSDSDFSSFTHYSYGGPAPQSRNLGTTMRIGEAAVTQTGVDYGFGDNMALLRFGFQSTDEFYSGGIALQTISNPTIKITPPTFVAGDDWSEREMEFEVYAKHSNLVRIDSDTGAVSRTLDV